MEADLASGGSLREMALPGVADPVSLAVDWIADHLYVVDGATSKLDLFSIDGRHRKNVLSSLARPTAVAVDPNVGFVDCCLDGQSFVLRACVYLSTCRSRTILSVFCEFCNFCLRLQGACS